MPEQTVGGGSPSFWVQLGLQLAKIIRVRGGTSHPSSEEADQTGHEIWDKWKYAFAGNRTGKGHIVVDGVNRWFGECFFIDEILPLMQHEMDARWTNNAGGNPEYYKGTFADLRSKIVGKEFVPWADQAGAVFCTWFVRQMDKDNLETELPAYCAAAFRGLVALPIIRAGLVDFSAGGNSQILGINPPAGVVSPPQGSGGVTVGSGGVGEGNEEPEGVLVQKAGLSGIFGIGLVLAFIYVLFTLFTKKGK